MRKNYVTFYSPGTFVSETAEKEIKEWDTKVAVKMASKIVERHGAKPYGFRFCTKLEAAPVLVEGKTLNVEPKVLEKSGMFFITGKVRTAKEILEGIDPKENILRVKCEK